eukprot:GFYU01004174.1.p1 GENE.GFYU01004174.1~~GFYU01004174.1.p1  ORF type:complete len:153 (-),score=41.27 GFYU01004174.1:271-729(-)
MSFLITASQRLAARALRSHNTLQAARAHLRTQVPAFSTQTRTYAEKVKVTFMRDGEQETVEGEVGQSLLDIAQENDIDIEGACEGCCACSTCHVIINDPEVFDALPEQEEEELDMLDIALDVTDTSRLGCQVIMTKELDGIQVTLPEVENMM